MKFYGVVGYGEQKKFPGGVYRDELVEYKYYGDVIKNTRRLVEGEKVNDDLAVQNSISIVADAYANEHFFAIRYVEWMGSLWKVAEVTVERPRLVLRLGGIYNGERPAPAA
jgi:hypothetical protein